ncbi:MarR family transcriptional regulator [Streptomyces sp. RFCAC02]|uniref:MarR family winged helix-turn-helix transcriptional regulator n=1 Tax=Streptomyces sp. RFCAC02 TaxID=2499143 RepID=UPI00101F213F|nr:MarR family transcriptional regulator [Streptomyces sp. RFCAC02]
MTASPDASARTERELCGLVGALARKLDDHVRERAAALDLTGPQATALRELGGPLTMKELAARMSCEPSNATFVVDRLERRGLIERRPHPTDRRAKEIHLTAGGAELRERLMDLLAHRSPVAALSGHEQDELRRLLLRATDQR